MVLSGHARVYEYNSGSWIQLGSDIDGEYGTDRFGYSVSLSSDGTVLAIGAIVNSYQINQKGSVTLYEYLSSSWSQLGGKIIGETIFDYFGHSVCLSSDGTIVAIGAKGNDDNGANSGHARVFNNLTTTGL